MSGVGNKPIATARCAGAQAFYDGANAVLVATYQLLKQVEGVRAEPRDLAERRVKEALVKLLDGAREYREKGP